jgi:hypothetical protein
MHGRAARSSRAQQRTKRNRIASCVHSGTTVPPPRVGFDGGARVGSYIAHNGVVGTAWRA